MQQTLRLYQKQAVKNILEAFGTGNNKIKISLPAGIGKSKIIVSVTKELLNKETKNSILILSSMQVLCDQLYNIIEENIPSAKICREIKYYKDQDILVTTYQDIISNDFIILNKFKTIICEEAQNMSAEQYRDLLNPSKQNILGILSVKDDQNSYFHDAEEVFRYNIQDAYNDNLRPYNEMAVIDDLIVPMLESYDVGTIMKEVKFNIPNSRSIIPDIVVKNDNSTIILEVKLYRSIFNQSQIITNAINQVKHYKDKLSQSRTEHMSFGLIMFCDIKEDFKKEVYEQQDIFIWDIKNIKYLCNSESLNEYLTNLIPYPINYIEATKPIHSLTEISRPKKNSKKIFTNVGTYLIEQLQNCKSGKKSFIEYEQICTEIIYYLFESEFSIISAQQKTKDEMFRMDLLCSLKGTTAFWKFLLRFYNTKFVVFEYKNYSKKISQNLIYISDKYLFTAALRNVAFIISRKGFDDNAYNAAMGILKESGKLIVDLKDEDLIKMIQMKENGEEPSDYLLNKIERLLMSVSK